MEVEQYEKWEPVEGITTPVARALVKEDHKGLFVTLVFSEIVDGINKDLRIIFGRVPAYAVYEELVHPWNLSGIESLPKLSGKWGIWSFPLLIVKNSMWLRSFSDSQLISYPNSIHYQCITLDQVIDVVCNRVPEVSWVKPKASDIEKA
jgi:hypothetical protein